MPLKGSSSRTSVYDSETKGHISYSDRLMIVCWKFIHCCNCSVLTHTSGVWRAKAALPCTAHSRVRGTCWRGVLGTFPCQKNRRTGGNLRKRRGELTSRNLDHPVPVGSVDTGGRRALIYGCPWRGLCSHPVPELHPAGCMRNPATEISLFLTFLLF